MPASPTSERPGSIRTNGILMFLSAHSVFKTFDTSSIYFSYSGGVSLSIYFMPKPPPRLSSEISTPSSFLIFSANSIIIFAASLNGSSEKI